MKLRSNKKISVFSILIVAILCITIGYAAINSVVLNITGKAEAKKQTGVFITNVEYVSGVDAPETNSTIGYYAGTTMQSKISLSKTNALSEIVYKVSVYNNSSEAATFLDAIYSKDNYDNENIVYEILDTGFKQEQKIAVKEQKDIYIKFKYKDGVLPTNNILNSYIKFSIGKPNMLKTASNTGDYFGAVTRSTIEKISFELGEIPENATKTFDASAKQDKSITGYVTDKDSNGLHEITFSSNEPIYTNTNSKYLFYGLTKLTNIEFNNFRTTETTDMSYMFYYCDSLTNLDLSKFNTSKVTNMSYMFYRCTSLTGLDISYFNTSNVTNMSNMFINCSSLTSLDVSKFDTSKVTSMESMFNNCSKLTSLDVSKFNTSNVTTMYYMFGTCSSLINLDVSKFNTSKVTNMNGMFSGCSSLTNLDVSKFDTSKAIAMSNMFYNCSSLTSLDVSDFNTSNVTSMSNMFYNCSKLTGLDVSNFNTSNVKYMSDMFNNCSNLTSLDLSNFNTPNVTTMARMFYSCSNLTSLDVSKFNTSNVTNMSYMFAYSSKLTTIYASDKFNTDKVTNSSSMFSSCTSLVGGNGTKYNSSYIDKTYARLDTAGTPGYFSEKKGYLKLTSSETNYSSTFLGMGTRDNITKVIFENTTKNAPSNAIDVSATSDRSIVGWLNGTEAHIASDVSIYANKDSSYLFARLTKCTAIENLNLLNTRETTDMSEMFYYCSSLTSLDLSDFDTSNVTTMSNMFYYCSSLTSLDLSDFDTSNVTTMSNMFNNCVYLTNLDISTFNTSNVTDMSYMFEFCSKLTDLDLSNFDTSNVTYMSEMFYDCSNLTSLDISNFNTSKVTNMDAMFSNCSNLTSLDVTKFDTSKVTNMMYMFYRCRSLTCIDISRFDTSNVTNMNYMFYGSSKLTTIYASDKFITDKVTDSFNMFYECTSLVGGNGTKYNSSYTDKTYARIDRSGTPGYFTEKSTLKSTLNETSSSSTFLGIGTRNNITKVIFENTKANAPSTAIDVSEAGNKSIVGWLSGTEVHIATDGNVLANKDSSNLFNYMRNLTEIRNLELLDTSKTTNMYRMFYFCDKLTNLDVSKFDTSNVTNMNALFGYCSGLTNLDVSKFNTSKVTNMREMFCGCSSLTSLDVSNFDTSKVTNMATMFCNCSNLTSLDLSKFDTSNVTIMGGMFNMNNDSTKLKTIYVSSKFKTDKVTDSAGMFYKCTAIVGGNGTVFNSNYIDKTYARIDTFSYPGYFTDANPRKMTATIPNGFVASEATGEKDQDTGLVIYEGTTPVTDSNVATAKKTRNQFVWVPVETMGNFTSNYLTLYSGITEAEKAEYNAMIASVEKYGGFYIGRYEVSMNSSTNKLQSVAEYIPYYFNGTATSFSNTLYSDVFSKIRSLTLSSSKEKDGIVTPVYGEQWKSTVDFVQKKYPDIITNFRSYGNYSGSIDRTGASSSTNRSQNNIWDMSGNEEEIVLAMKAHSLYSSTLYTFPTYGGRYNYQIAMGSCRTQTPLGTGYEVGFRMAIYLK